MYIHQFVEAYKTKFSEKKPVSDKTIRTYLDRLCELNYVEKRPSVEDRRCNIYEPLVKERKNLQNTLNFKNREDLKVFLEKGLKTWEENITEKDTFKIAKKGGEYGILWEEISVEDVKTKILYIQNNNLVEYFLTKNITLTAEKKPEKNTKTENSVIRTNSDDDDFWNRILDGKKS